MARDPSPTDTWGDRLASLVRRAVTALRRERRSRRAVAELAALDNRMLRDIGISRCAIACAHAGRREEDPA